MYNNTKRFDKHEMTLITSLPYYSTIVAIRSITFVFVGPVDIRPPTFLKK
jgi:hypothetical protein